ncbi:aminotransferase class I/II-fold pyridoxal phosphate-dependent enzyme [Salinibacterium sp. SYSU T00001]|uniref:aminotransferase class I/II-fold pyridoxal phosphate-dependent enzyme n=1 Tax=Homoserinimonas sedimenticola TaxID=2986805 RepID=UPI00223589EF|nr:aminotransferase class I/II-fold pyridoxal phosphate-dependent enzyme [Salinibacterium sedimenticola]MCW4386553.1 aminotransferase class I/II-fold pyridoxal phosphate-dependent enzyme [Salinibacterium sedimenticola]
MTIPGPWSRSARAALLLDDSGALSQTIFAEMTMLATEHGAINLGQGYPDEDGPSEVLDAARQAILDGVNQYPPGVGQPVLREAVAAHQRRFYDLEVDPEREVMVTAGATEALAATILALTEAGDEVVTFSPFYDSYAALIGLTGARHRTVPLRAPDFRPDHDELRAAVSDRTRIILINDPHNPTGSILDRETLQLVVELAQRHDAVIVTDEVYEHLVFDGGHRPIATLSGARERTVTISSGGKTFNTTGWKVGWLTAPAPLLQAILAVKQYLTYANAAPLQPAIAVGLGLPDSYFLGLTQTLRRRRDLLAQGLAAAGMQPFLPRAGYFVVADAASLGVSDAHEFCRSLPSRIGIAAVPLTAFVHPEDRAEVATLVRFAFCKRDDVIAEASARLLRLRD